MTTAAAVRRPRALVRERRDPDGARRAHGLRGMRLRLDVAQQRKHLIADERLLLQQRLREPVERRAVLLGQPNGVRLSSGPAQTYWGKDSAIFIEEVLAWLSR